jgi:Uncharacterised nucleotidyltransferase
MTDDDVVALEHQIAAFGLPGTRSTIADRIADDAWPRLLALLTTQRLTGLAVAAMNAGAVTLSQRQAGELLERQRASMVHALSIERFLLSLADIFDREGIDMIVLKGPALANAVYSSPSWRPFGDVDVLVPTPDWRRVGEVLHRNGLEPKFPEPRPRFRERFGHTWVHTDRMGLELDLHRILVAGPFGLWMDPQDPFEHTDTFWLGGQPLRRLDDVAAFVHACMHAALGHRPPLLLPLRDAAELACSRVSDWSQVRELASRWRTTTVVEYALNALTATLSLDLPVDARLAIRSTEVSRRERLALRAYTTSWQARGGKATVSLLAIRGVGAKAAYVRALLVPDREFLAFREGGVGPGSLRVRWRKALGWLRSR